MSDATAGRAAIRCVLAGGIGGAAPVLAAELLRRSSPLFVAQELAGVLLGAALLASASFVGARAASASGATRALIAVTASFASGAALALLSPPWVVLAVPWALLPVAAGLVLAQLASEPTPRRAFNVATCGAVVGVFALHLLRSSPAGALLFDVAPHVPLLFGVWGALLGLALASGDGRELARDLPLGGGSLLLIMWALSSTIGYATDHQAVRAGDRATRARALASMEKNHDLWKVGLTLRSPTGDDRQDIGDLLCGALVGSVAVWPSRVDRPTPAEVRCDLLRAVGDHLLIIQSTNDRNPYLRRLVEDEARFQRDLAVRAVAIETMTRLEPDWRDPLEVWVSDPDGERRAAAYVSISGELHRLSSDDLLKLVSRAGELPESDLGRVVGVVKSVAIASPSGAAPIAGALLASHSARLAESDRATLEKLANPAPPRALEPLR